MAQHTPGPWNVAGDYRGWTTVQDQRCNIITFCQQKPNAETMRADLRLIAAAPDLLEALAALVNSPNAKQNAMWDRARAALARAEGN